MIKRFKDEPPKGAHADFQAWRERWPGGFFLNLLSAKEAMLHRVACGHLESPEKELAGDWNLTKREKVCSVSAMLLRAWAMREGLVVSRCRDCGLPEENSLDIAVACADIGSVAKGKFGWALKHGESWSQGDSIVAFSDQILSHLNQNTPVAVGFECPLFVPLPRDPKGLTRARKGEGKRAWCAGAGSGALAVGLTEVVWILREVWEGLDVPERPTASLRWPQFVETGGLFIWEAFVTGASKKHSHIQDAKGAVDALVRALPDPERRNLVHEETVYSLGGAALLRAGWGVPTTVLGDPTLVISADNLRRTRPFQRTRSGASRLRRALKGKTLVIPVTPVANEPLPIKVSGSALTVGDRRWRAEHPIVDAHQVDDVVCVLLDYMSFPRHQQARNLRGYSLSGRLLWIAEHPTNQTTDCYTSIQPASRASQILAGNFAGYNCVIDARTGELLDSVFTK